MSLLEEKEEIISRIKELISVDGSITYINPAYLEYFELEELVNIKDELEGRKKDIGEISKGYLDEIYEKCT